MNLSLKARLALWFGLIVAALDQVASGGSVPLDHFAIRLIAWAAVFYVYAIGCGWAWMLRRRGERGDAAASRERARIASRALSAGS